MLRVGEGRKRPARSERVAVSTVHRCYPPRYNPPVPHRIDRRVFTLGLLLVGVMFASLLYLLLGGAVLLPTPVVLHELFRGPQADEGGVNAILWGNRLPSECACLLVGASLGLAGSAFQALFRNPLADPFVVGTASGAAVGGACAIVFGLRAYLGDLAMPLVGFATGFGALMLVLALSRRRGMVDVSSLLLAGAVTGSMLSALQSMILLLAGQDSNQVLRWLLGSMHPMFWARCLLLFIGFAIGAVLLVGQAKALNALAIGDSTAHQLGIHVRGVRRRVLVVGTGLVALCVGSVGVIGFLGLAAPHIARRLLGVDWRFSMVGASLIGAILLLFADGLTQHTYSVGEMPVGVVTALLGAPFLLVLLRKD
jgi:iron complex transport system permease protein